MTGQPFQLSCSRNQPSIIDSTLAILSIISDKGPEDVKKSVREADELPWTRMTYGVFYRRSSAFIGAPTG
jgi:hypothetical protein